MEIALTKTLARKHRVSVKSIYRKYATRREVDGYSYKVLAVEIPSLQGNLFAYWGGIPLKRMELGDGYITDRTTKDPLPTSARVDLIRRLQAKRCELCGAIENCQVHHVRKLVDIKRKWHNQEKPAWVKRMIALRRRTLIVCAACHEEIHAAPN